MKGLNLKIGTQLKFGFAALLFFVFVIGLVSYLQTEQIHSQTEIMYKHPLQVRRALGELRADILSMQRDMKDMLLSSNKEEVSLDLNQIDKLKINAQDKFTFLYNNYLGPRSDIDSVKQAFEKWNLIHDETTRLFQSGNKQAAVNQTRTVGVGGKQAEVVLRLLQKMDDFALNKGDELYKKSQELKNSLSQQLVLLITIIVLLSIFINYFLLRNMRKPLEELNSTTRRFHEGDMSARSSYALQNEFGVLSDSINSLAESIEENTGLKEKTETLAGVMLGENDPKQFFLSTLNTLANLTSSQMAAVYLLSEDEKSFEHFESIGINDNARKSFSASSFEGEFGSVLSSHEVQHLKNISEDTRFVFNTVSGKYIPREIITIPILGHNKVVAIISLASIGRYDKQSILFINSILDTMSARFEGILGNRKIKEFSDMLEHQNIELEAQKTELAFQSAELQTQNTTLESQKIELQEASRLKTSFLSNMSHELRTPLNSVIALSGVLNRKLINTIPKEEYSYLEVIERNGKHLLSLINDVLDISRIEAGREEIDISIVNLNNLIADVVSMILPQAQQKNIEVEFLRNNSELLITSDAKKCNHILLNIIGNAVKFTEKGSVSIKTRLKEKEVEISIADTGIGISEIHLPHVFDEFRQADGSTSRKYGGTGLGLAIAKKYAHMLGGTITVSSMPGKGSEFIISLPLIHHSDPSKSEAETTTDINYDMNEALQKTYPDSDGKTILVVEDNEPAIVQIKDFLEEEGYNILIAHDGAEALAIIAQTIPDAMILDLMMPGVDGFQVLKTIRETERTAKIPVLILTAKHVSKEELKFLKHNNIFQLIRKGEVKRKEMIDAVAKMVFANTDEILKTLPKRKGIDSKAVVLVVEDNPDNMITVKALLADNYTVIEATDGNESVETARKHLPNLILMDISMPLMDGIEAYKEIRKLPELRHTPIIALTASAMTSDRETILAFGFDAYIPKPIDEKIFFKTINETFYGG